MGYWKLLLLIVIPQILVVPVLLIVLAGPADRIYAILWMVPVTVISTAVLLIPLIRLWRTQNALVRRITVLAVFWLIVNISFFFVDFQISFGSISKRFATAVGHLPGILEVSSTVLCWTWILYAVYAGWLLNRSQKREMQA